MDCGIYLTHRNIHLRNDIYSGKGGDVMGSRELELKIAKLTVGLHESMTLADEILDSMENRSTRNRMAEENLAAVSDQLQGLIVLVEDARGGVFG